MSDLASEVRDILVFHLGAEEARLTDDARLAEDLGADRLDLVEIAMSCELRFNIDIPNHDATRLATVGDTIRLVEARIAGAAAPAPLFRAALHALSSVFQRTSSTASSS